MSDPLLASVEIATGPDPKASVIWLHGLGADGHDFEPAVPQLMRGQTRALRFVFPHAPVRPVTLNGGMPMRAWYDILQLNRLAAEDEPGVRSSYAALQMLIRRENERGVASEHIVLAGFSQGGAMALYSGTRLPERIAGIVGLSCYMPIAAAFSTERHISNHGTPIFMAHGSLDPVVGPDLGETARALLVASGYAVDWHSYPMGHSVCAEELAAVAAFLQRVL
jgi:phospholipase/carboxylesterase